MRFLKQTKTGAMSNCIQTCVACVLDLDIAAVPDFCNQTPVWYEALREWLWGRGLDAVDRLAMGHRQEVDPWVLRTRAPVLVGGRSHRHDEHAVIFHNGKMWDPHPDNTGLVRYDYAIVLVARQPQHLATPDAAAWARALSVVREYELDALSDMEGADLDDFVKAENHAQAAGQILKRLQKVLTSPINVDKIKTPK